MKYEKIEETNSNNNLNKVIKDLSRIILFLFYLAGIFHYLLTYLFRLTIPPNVVIKQLSMYVLASDQSYMPNHVVIYGGRDEMNLRELNDVKIPVYVNPIHIFRCFFVCQLCLSAKKNSVNNLWKCTFLRSSMSLGFVIIVNIENNIILYKKT